MYFCYNLKVRKQKPIHFLTGFQFNDQILEYFLFQMGY
jgi:hypothetical protein